MTNDRSYVCECLTLPFRLIGVLVWPVICVCLGIVFGTTFSIIVTLIVSAFTFLRTPMHLWKMLYVTWTTEECFHGYLSRIMRLVVLLSVPVVHVLFLLAVTLFSATVGTLYYIGKATKIFYKHEYSKTVARVESNARLEPRSPLGKHLAACRDFMESDSPSHPTIYTLKWMWAMVIPGLLLSTIMIIPFSLSVLAITLYRLPINVYKTTKIVFCTVILKWDLRLIVLMLLPFIHLAFPLVAFFSAVVGSFFWTWWRTTLNIFQGDNPFHKWKHLREALERYYKEHEQFVSVRCSDWDHPSGIPNGWDGTQYGIAIARILRWQRDFLICCFFVVLEAPICLLGTSIISVIKYIPSCFHSWKEYCRSCCCEDDSSCLKILSMWPFHVLGILLLPAGVLICFIVLGIYDLLQLPFAVPTVLFWEDLGWCAAWEVQFDIMKDHDEMTGSFCGDFRVAGDQGIFGCCCSEERSSRAYLRRSSTERSPGTTAHRGDSKASTEPTTSYWDRFANQSIRTTAMLIQRGWVSKDDIEDLDPCVIQSIPAVSALIVLIDSVKEEGLNKNDLKWNIDGTLCQDGERKLNDGISRHLWPIVIDIKTSLIAMQKKKLLTNQNKEVLMAMLCTNGEGEPQALKTALAKAPTNIKTMNNHIRTKVNRLVLAILRVRPYQQRMDQIFTYDYNYDDIPDVESGVASSVRPESRQPTASDPELQEDDSVSVRVNTEPDSDSEAQD